MKTFPFLLAILASIAITSTSARDYTDEELLKLFNTPVDLQAFVDTIFTLPLTEQLYVYNYINDLINYLPAGSKLQTFLYSAIAKMQNKIDNFSARYNLETKPVSDFLIKGIDLELKILSKAATKNQSVPIESKSVSKPENSEESALKPDKKYTNLPFTPAAAKTVGQTINQSFVEKSAISSNKTQPDNNQDSKDEAPKSLLQAPSKIKPMSVSTWALKSPPKYPSFNQASIIKPTPKEDETPRPPLKLLLSRTLTSTSSPMASLIKPLAQRKDNETNNSKLLTDDIVTPAAEKIGAQSALPKIMQLPQRNTFRKVALSTSRFAQSNKTKSPFAVSPPLVNSASPSSFSV